MDLPLASLHAIAHRAIAFLFGDPITMAHTILLTEAKIPFPQRVVTMAKAQNLS